MSKAVDWYQRSAQHGNPNAQYRLAGMYFYGSTELLPKDVEQGISLYRNAAERGNYVAAHTLGDIYYSGTYIPRDLQEAEKWYRLAVNYGDTSSQQRLDTIIKGEVLEIPPKNNTHWLIGDWKGGVSGSEIILHIEKQDAENFSGNVSVYGPHISCKDSAVTLVPDSDNKHAVKKYDISFSGFGCRGNGTLAEEGIALKGQMKFGYEQAKRMTLFKSGYEPEGMKFIDGSVVCFVPYLFWLCM